MSRYTYPQQLRPLPNQGHIPRALPIQKPNPNQVQRPANRKSYFQIIPAIATSILISIITLSTASLPIIIRPFALITRCISSSGASILSTFRRLWESVSKPRSNSVAQETQAVPPPTSHPQQQSNDASHSPIDTPDPTQRPAYQKSSKPIPTLQNPPFRFKYPVRQHFKRVVPQAPAYVPPPQAPSSPVMPKGRGQALRRDKSPVTVFRNPNLPVRMEIIASLEEDYQFNHLRPEIEGVSDANGRLNKPTGIEQGNQGSRKQIVEQRYLWHGPAQDLKNVLEELPPTTTSLVIRDCEVALGDVFWILARCPHLEILHIQDIVNKAPIPHLSEPHGRPGSSVRSLTLTSEVPLEPFFERLALHQLETLSLRLFGDGNATDFKSFLHPNSPLEYLRLRGHFSDETEGLIRQLCSALLKEVTPDIGHLCRSTRLRRRQR
ncbi:hypothetical protein CC1G_11732 [Coprinopsis cinerea okayama7|uniref:Uncharacterized protein n=1 Tax=Coprinopsis cinerea (strain Okayama-7 / 130 / ATCC MYA-4618 / FGSC 9003) TaxID=240176 RepID=A8NJY6_COPC7|nr:hypothetical protein CC1G_11732 [Coprinopsis cinerea okayama7\|eukprot:XP_001834323.1 hypothetical protein CC1G_11732 [Coprinopsis cinerea okayama7\